MHQHTGGTHQHEALKAFDNALDYFDASDSQIVTFKVQVFLHKGMLLKTMGRGPEAIECYDDLIELSDLPEDLASAFHHKSDALMMMGKVSEAIPLLKQALVLSSNSVGNYLPLVKCYQETKELSTSQWVDLYNEILARYQPLSHTITDSSVQWALFLSADSAKLLDISWGHLQKAHEMEIRNRGSSFDGGQLKSQLQNLKSIFRPESWPNGALIGMQTSVPVFIVGMMRSGSTLLETMLDSHPDLVGLGEDSVFNANLPEFRDDLVRSSQSIPALRDIIHRHGRRVLGRMREAAEQVIRFAQSNLTRTKSLQGENGLRLVDKMLFNYRNIGFIHLMFPNALILHTVRDPMDTLFSIFKNKFDDRGLEWSLVEEHLVLQYAVYLEIMDHFRTHYPDQIIDIRYEELVSRPEEVMRGVLGRLDVDWHENILHFYKMNRTVQTHSISQVRQGLYSASIGGWRKYSKQLQPLARKLKKLLNPLKSRGALPFLNEMNWDLEPSFPYPLTPLSPQPIDPVGGKAVASSVPNSNDTCSLSLDPPRRDIKSRPSPGQRFNLKANRNTSTPPTKHSSQPPISPSPSQLNQLHLSSTKGLSPIILSSLRDRLLSLQPSQLHSSLLVSNTTCPPVSRSSGSDLLDEILSAAYLLTTQQNHSSSLEILKKLLSLSSLGLSKDVCKIKLSFSDTPSYSSSSAPLSCFEPSLFVLTIHRTILTNQLKLDLKKQASKTLSTLLDIFQCPPLQSFLSRSSHSLEPLSPLVVDFLNALSSRVEQSVRDNDSDRTRKDLDSLIHFHSNRLETFRAANTSETSSLTSLVELYFHRGVMLFQQSLTRTASQDFLRALSLVYLPSAPLLDDGQTLSIPKNYMPSASHYLDRSFDSISLSLQLLASPALDSQLYSSVLLSKLWNYHGKCEKLFGHWQHANHSQAFAIELDPSNREAYIDRSAALMEGSSWEESLVPIHTLLTAVDSQVKNAYGYQGLLFQSMGRSREAVEQFDLALKIDPSDQQCLFLSAVCLHALGDLHESLRRFDLLLGLNPSHTAQGRRGSAAYYAGQLDDSVLSFNPDVEIKGSVKEGENVKLESVRKKLSQLPTKSASLLSENFEVCVDKRKQCHASCATRSNANRLLNLTKNLSSFLQLSSPGFLPNGRQHRMFGLGVLQMAQELRVHASSLEDPSSSQPDPPGLLVLDSTSSSLNYIGLQTSPSSSGVPRSTRRHIFGWRDWMDIAVRWRATSEPMDLVWWGDQFPPKDDYRKRVGVNTYLHHGVTESVRYFPYFPSALNLTRWALGNDKAFDARESYIRLSHDPLARTKATTASNLPDLFRAAGSQPFFVVVPCQSQLNSSRTLNGTRLTLQPAHPSALQEGSWDFSINAPVTPERSRQFEEEFHALFQNILLELGKILQEDNDRDLSRSGKRVWSHHRQSKPQPTPVDRKYRLLQSALDFFYFWATASPLSRGSSATGYMALYSVLLAAGDEMALPLPPNRQLDWEAILSTSAEEFRSRVQSWFTLKPTTLPPETLCSIENSHRDCPQRQLLHTSQILHPSNKLWWLPRDLSLCSESCSFFVSESFPTPRSMLAAISDELLTNTK